MRVLFWGSPEFAVATLQALLASRHTVVGVVTRPPRRRGRGRRPSPTPVARVAEAAGLPVLAPARPRGPEFLAAAAALAPDVSVVAAYGAILPPAALELPPHGSLNVHASLLPAWRGAAPVTRSILAGDAETGVSIMRMDAGLDTGPVLLAEPEPIGPGDSAGAVTGRLAARGARLLVQALDRLEAGALTGTPQDDAGATFAPRIGTAEAEIDWARSTAGIERTVRAFDPWPGAWTEAPGGRLKVFRVAPAEGPAGVPATVVAVEPEPVVRTGDGAAALVEVQPPGGRRMSGADWARGRRVAIGDRLGPKGPEATRGGGPGA